MFYTEDDRKNLSHSACYEKGMHDASKAGRAHCRNVRRGLASAMLSLSPYRFELPSIPSLIPDMLAQSDDSDAAAEKIEA